ncbi:F0F1 ATP synthase subunit B [Anaerolineae bacterium CFX9]|jgi:F-type H+-transporting ATPase subunit b|nr:F0F1 ATP synthase subunit B [Geitlerinema splendidum]MDL1902223.1 F0F1 ATP synthase subunit B [Anaerolineae bacterium CFX9]
MKNFKYLLLVMVLLAGFVFAGAISAQEGAGDHGETAAAATTEATAEAATNPLTPLGINTGFLLAQMINFLLLFFLLSRVLWNPLVNMLDSRSATIAKGLEDAAAAANARRNAEAEAEKIRAEARAEVSRVIEEGRGRAEEIRKQIEAEARAEADKIRAEERARASTEVERQLGDLRAQVANIAVAVSQQLIGASMDEKRQQQLINDFFAKVPASAKSLSGDIEVVSALPLSDSEKERVRKETGAANVTFSVDPGILGGLVIRSADRVVDGSVRSNLNDLSGRLR